MQANENSKFLYKDFSKVIDDLKPVRDDEIRAIIFDLSEICEDLILTIHRDGKDLVFILKKKGVENKIFKVFVKFVVEEGMLPGSFCRDFERALKDFGVEIGGDDFEALISRIKREIFENQDMLLKADDLKRFEVKTLAEVISEAKPIEFLVDRLIPRRSLLVVAGKGGVGKSTAVLGLVHDLVAGRPVFGEFASSEVGKVLIVDEENYKSFYLHRCQLLGIDHTDRIHCCIMQGLKLDHEDGISFLEEIAEDYDVIVLDSWSNLIMRTDENKAGEVTRILNSLRRLAYEHDCTIILIHHVRKNVAYVVEDIDELRGSSALVNEPDLVYIFQQDKTTGNVIVKCVKNRFGEPISFRLAFEEDEEEKLSIIFKGFIEAVEVETQVMRCAKAVFEFLSLKQEARWKEIVEAIEFSESTIKRTLRYLESIGLVERPRKGVYKLAPQRQLSCFGQNGQSGQNVQTGHSIIYSDQTDQTLNIQSKTHDDEDTRNGQNVQHILCNGQFDHSDHSDHNQTNYATSNNIKKDELKTLKDIQEDDVAKEQFDLFTVERRRDVKLYKCKVCDSFFISQNDVLAHIEAVHKGKGNVRNEPKGNEIVEFKVKNGLPKWILDHEIDLGNDKRVRIGAKKIHKLPYRIAKGLEFYGLGKVIG